MMRLLAFLLGLLLFASVALAQQSTAIPGLGGGFISNEDELLEPDQAFKLTVAARDGTTVVAQFSPAPGYYLYRQRISFGVEATNGINVASIDLPPGEVKNDPILGETRVFHQPFSALVSLKRDADSPDRVKLKATYQGCSDKGVCYPPINKTFDLVLTSGAAAEGPRAAESAVRPGKEPLLSDPGIGEKLVGGSLWLAIGGFFLAGLGLAFTPCVLPMVPILSGIIAGHGRTLTRARGLVLSLSYVLGMAITYALAGIAAGLSGTLLAAALQNVWVLGTFALVFVLLALSMFGVYDLHMPAAIRHGASMLSHRLTGGRLAAVFAMGALSALIVSPCVAAPLAGALLYISQTRDVVFGGTVLFALALGMGVPLMAIGISAGTLLPKAGPWMNTVKRFFGVLLLAVAIWIVSPVIPVVAQMLLWAALLIITAIFLRAIDPLPQDASGFSRFAKGVGLMTLAAGLAVMVGALSGSRDLLQPLAALRSGGAVLEASDVGFDRIRSIAELDQRLGETDRPVLLDFYADWCVSCKEMEQFTFRDTRVADRLQDMLLLQVDVTENTAEDQALLKRFGLFGPPGIIFFDADGREIRGLRVIGYQPAETFLHAVERAFDPTLSGQKPTLTFLRKRALPRG